MEELAKKTQIYLHDNILDVGTGKGQFIPDLKLLFPDFSNITGIDPSSISIGQAIEIYKDEKNIDFKVMDTNSMSFKDNSFDIVSISNILHHLTPKNKLFKEIKRVLKPSGILFVIELYQDNQSDQQLTHVMQHHFRAEVDTRNNVFHRFTFKRYEIVDFLKAQNLHALDIFDFSDTKRMNSSNPKYLDSVIEGIKNSIKQTTTFSDSEDFQLRGNQILARINSVGFMMPKQLVAICKFESK